MKNSAIVDGVVLTREQVERAVKQLDQPEVLLGGQLVRLKGGGPTSTIYMVVSGELDKVVMARWRSVNDKNPRITDGYNTWSCYPSNALEVVTVK